MIDTKKYVHEQGKCIHSAMYACVEVQNWGSTASVDNSVLSTSIHTYVRNLEFPKWITVVFGVEGSPHCEVITVGTPFHFCTVPWMGFKST